MLVRFTFNIADLSKKSGRYDCKNKLSETEVCDRLNKLFGYPIAGIVYAEPIEMTCTPEEFARFIVMRRDWGCCNEVRSLNIQLIEDVAEAPRPKQKFASRDAHKELSRLG